MNPVTSCADQFWDFVRRGKLCMNFERVELLRG